MERFLKNQIAMVTGGGRGVGKAIAVKLAQFGACVVITDPNFNEAQKTARSITRIGQRAKAYRMDVSKKNEVDVVFKRLRKEFGRLDILINNTGISSVTPFEKISEKEWDRILHTHLKGTFLCSQAAFRLMKLQRSGKMINLSSMASRLGGMISPGFYHPYAHCVASEAAIEALTKSIAFEAAPYGIRVNAVSRGSIHTEISKGTGTPERKRNLLATIPLGRLATPNEIASAVLFLVSEKASYITAKTLDVNGGVLMD
jgi:3-oxoacyl-[acyl-carrier protein] reductase